MVQEKRSEELADEYLAERGIGPSWLKVIYSE